MTAPSAPPVPRALRPLIRAASVLRDGWVVLGITLGMFLLLEGVARLVISTEETGYVHRYRQPGHPYHETPWFPELLEELERRDHRYDPYRGYWLRPMHSRHINTDALGRRATPQVPAGEGAAEVWLLGGSVMWGYTARDSFTIPALVARELGERGVKGVRVVNLAQRGFVSTQELTTLMVELGHGRRPVAAVLLNGVNDMTATLGSRAVGRTLSEDYTQGLIDMDSRGAWHQLLGLRRWSVLLGRIGAARIAPVGVDSRERLPDDATREQICAAAADYYYEIHRMVSGLGREYGFTPITFLQPIAAGSGKVFTEWERPFAGREGIRVCTAAFAARMAGEPPERWQSLLGLFDGDSGTVFIDGAGHVTETGNLAIAERIADALVPVLTRVR